MHKRDGEGKFPTLNSQFREAVGEERKTCKTPSHCCLHCAARIAMSSFHWHLCVCTEFGHKQPDFQAMLRTCVPESSLKPKGNRELARSWTSITSPPKRTKVTDTIKLCEEANKLIAKWALMYKISSSAIDSQEFRDIVLLLNPEIYKFPDKSSLSGPLIESIYQQTQMQVAEHFSRCESLQLRLPSETQESGASAQNAAVQVYDGRGSFFYHPVPTSSGTNVPLSQRLMEVAVGIAEMRTNTVVSVVPAELELSEAQQAQLTTTVQAFEAAYPEKILASSPPFSPFTCAELIVSNVPAVRNALYHVQCILQYLHPSTEPGKIVRAIAEAMGTEGVLVPNFGERLVLEEITSVASACAMLDVVSAAQQAGVFTRLLKSPTYLEYICLLSEEDTDLQESASVQLILADAHAMAGIVQAAFALQLLLTTSSKAMRPQCATYSDALAVRDALNGAVNKTARLSSPWKAVVLQIIASQWDHTYHPLVALASKLDPRRRFGDLPGTMEADAQRLRDKLIARLDPAQREAVIDSWVQLLKREDCFGEAYVVDNAHLQSPVGWWVAHTAAHRELREFIAYPVLSALGVNLVGNCTRSACDPSYIGASTEADVADTVHTAELLDEVIQSVELTEKLAFVRRNCWSLHHARDELCDRFMQQFALLTPGDLLRTQ